LPGLRVADRLANCITDPRAPDQITHSLTIIVGFRPMMIAAGNDATACAAIRSSRWRRTWPHQSTNCTRNRWSRGWNTRPTGALCCAPRSILLWFIPAGSQAHFARRRDEFDAVSGGQRFRLFLHAGVY
jgi:hypothetical protein